MNQLHLLWICPACFAIGMLWGVSAGLYWGGRRWANVALRLVREEIEKRKK